MATPTAIVAYLALFAFAAAVFLFVNLLLGRFLRPNLPNEEKLEIYECGEPTIGSSFVQFDLRFYVVALLFIIFDVEVAFFFPWATVFGKATQLSSPNMPVVTASVDPGNADPGADGTSAARGLSLQVATRLKELGIKDPILPQITAQQASELGVSPGTAEASQASMHAAAKKLAAVSIADIGVFFAVLMVGFFYVWRRGDLDWVRSTQSQQGTVVERAPPAEQREQAERHAGSILSA